MVVGVMFGGTSWHVGRSLESRDGCVGIGNRLTRCPTKCDPRDVGFRVSASQPSLDHTDRLRVWSMTSMIGLPGKGCNEPCKQAALVLKHMPCRSEARQYQTVR